MSMTILEKDSELNDRTLLRGGAATVVCVPAIVRATSVMPVRSFEEVSEPQHAGFAKVRLGRVLINRGRSAIAD